MVLNQVMYITYLLKERAYSFNKVPYSINDFFFNSYYIHSQPSYRIMAVVSFFKK